MQYFSPYNGCPNNEANFPYIPISAQPVVPRSQIVGEGDVTSVTLPDGTLQLFFIPVSRATSTCFGSSQWGTIPAWFIRTIPNLTLFYQGNNSFPPPLQPFASTYRDGQRDANNSLQNNVVTEDVPKYQLQLHNDKQTSSTDLHYFCQQTQPFSWYSRQSVQTQANQPVRACEACCKSCHCGGVDIALDDDMSIDNTIEKPPCSCYRNANKVHFTTDSYNLLIRDVKSVQCEVP